MITSVPTMLTVPPTGLLTAVMVRVCVFSSAPPPLLSLPVRLAKLIVRSPESSAMLVRLSSTATGASITAVNDAPVAVDDNLTSIAEDSGDRTISFASLTGNDSKGGGAEENTQTLTITAVNNPVGGTVSIVGTDVIISPTLNFNLPARFDYTGRHNLQSSSPLANDFKTDVGSVSFTITAVNFFFNDPAATEIYTLSLPDALPICFASLTGNDSRGGGADENTQTLTITAVNNPVGGTVSIVGTDVI